MFISNLFEGHDLIAKQTWSLLTNKTTYWLCSVYDVCNYQDFQTLSVLPDLLKHEGRFLKYFDLHFFNNPIDCPPMHCEIDVARALDKDKPNLLRAIKGLQSKFEIEVLSFQEFAYFIHLLADLHQPFHSTIYEVE